MLGTVGSQLGVLQLGALWGASETPVDGVPLVTEVYLFASVGGDVFLSAAAGADVAFNGSVGSDLLMRASAGEFN